MEMEVKWLVLLLALTLAGCKERPEATTWDMPDETTASADEICRQHPKEKVCQHYLGTAPKECYSDPETGEEECNEAAKANDKEVVFCFSSPEVKANAKIARRASHLFCPSSTLFFAKGRLLEKVKMIPLKDPQADLHARKAMAHMFGIYKGLAQILTAQVKAGSPTAKELQSELSNFDREVHRLLPAVQLDQQVMDDTSLTVITGFNILLSMAKQYDKNQRAELKAKCDAGKAAGKALMRQCYFLAD